ncbi:MAG: putative hydrolases or acyltransferases (alpha/beta hydrolase superfamily) [Algoriphagus marincola HL-49]|uniref:Putative hydrolases or acyltransferases (Alpha/beta hydrolase superfamily) n=1 Tax=Algoriphagus marincola HL-49 TaxID=1305737 RepID=A0A0P7XUY0_9BACT|nr:MAG: putative hydrolases or acyltransferases (alpha/beta hydrolase superfamily) [Algoriphagus marincola HL-49]
MSADKNVVFLHGAGLSSYIWEDFSQQYFPGSICAPFPLRESNQAFKRKITLEDYCQSVGDTILKHSPDRKVVLICHSISAIVGLRITKSLRGKIKGIIGVGASVPHSSRHFFSTLPASQRFLMPWIIRLTGTKPPAKIIRNSLCIGLDASIADKIVNAYSDESYHLYASKIQYDLAGIYRGYVKLLSDKAYPLSAQELSISNFQPHSVKELSSGHLPMLSHPNELATILESMLLDNEREIK